MPLPSADFALAGARLKSYVAALLRAPAPQSSAGEGALEEARRAEKEGRERREKEEAQVRVVTPRAKWETGRGGGWFDDDIYQTVYRSSIMRPACLFGDRRYGKTSE